MPRFYFDVIDNGRITRDEEALELTDFQHARNQALAALADMAKDELPDGDHREFVIEVRDGGPEPLLRASLALKVEKRI